MRILIIGGGGREHALAWKLSSSPRVAKLFAAPGSSAISQFAECVALPGPEAVADFAEKEQIDLTVIGPEAPLVDGWVDSLEARGLRAFGPGQAAAALEGSKAFSKAFMERHGISTAPYAAFQAVEPALAYLETLPGPCVVKADGLAAGKGVILCPDRETARAAVKTIMVDKAFGAAGAQVVIEGFLKGEEASFFAISDGQDYIIFPSAQDHKPIGDLDRGPNTGGMGAYCPAPVVTPELERRVIAEVVEPTLRGMAAEGHPYKGVLYVGLMIDQGEPQVLEYNCRFGDPECQPLMMMLESDLLDILEASATGGIGKLKPVWRSGAAACMVMASGGYPGDYPMGVPIHGLEYVAEDDHCRVFHAGTVQKEGQWLTNGGRVLGVTAWGADLGIALARGYRALEQITWKDATYRRDIGLKGMKRDRAGRPGVNVGVVLGSASDMEIARKATAMLEKLGVDYELAIASAHRTPARTRKFVRACEEAGAEVFIAIAGMAAALPGVVAAETLHPVIGVPVKSSAFEGLDALLSIAQMPPGIPVATVAVNGGENAGVLAAQILALKYPDIAAALKENRLELALKVEDAHKSAGLSTLV